MTEYFEAPDGHEESAIWVRRTSPLADVPVIHQNDVQIDAWPDVVARMTGTVVTNDDATVQRVAKAIGNAHSCSESNWSTIDLARAALKALTEQSQTADTGAEMIATERTRQIKVESYTIEHDAHHHPETLVRAAIAYLMAADGNPAEWWPWDASAFKPGDRRRELIKAGALIAAALDVLAALTGVPHD